MLNLPFVQEHLASFIKEKENLQEALHAKLVDSAQGRIQDFKRGGGWQTIFIEGC